MNDRRGQPRVAVGDFVRGTRPGGAVHGRVTDVEWRSSITRSEFGHYGAGRWLVEVELAPSDRHNGTRIVAHDADLAIVDAVEALGMLA